MFSTIVDHYATSKNYFDSSVRSAIAVTRSTITTVLAGHHLASTRNIRALFHRRSGDFDAKSSPRPKARGAYRIVLTSGLVLILREVFERASCINLGLRATHDPLSRRRRSVDMTFPPTVGAKATYLKAAERSFSRPSWWQHMTPARIEWAHYMTLLGVWFIVNHEIAHIIRGHFTYLKKRGFTGELSELSFLNEDEATSNFKHRFLEYDADNFAFDLMVWQVETRFGPLRKSNPDATSMVFQMYLAALLIFLLLDRNTPRLAFSDKTSHPPLLARAAQLTQTLFDIFRDTDIPLQNVGSEIKRTLTGCCRLALHLGIPNGRWRAGKLLGKEFELSLDDRDSYLGLLKELNKIADLKSTPVSRQSPDRAAPRKRLRSQTRRKAQRRTRRLKA